MIKTANDCPEKDPKDWIMKCTNLEGDEVEADTVEGEAPRDRFTEKTYRCSNPTWTTGVSIEITGCQEESGFCQLNEF